MMKYILFLFPLALCVALFPPVAFAQPATAPAASPSKPAAAPIAPPSPQWAACSKADHPQAVQACGTVLQTPGLSLVQQAAAHHARALAQHRAGRAAEAIADLNAALTRTPGNAVYINDRGFVLATQNRLDEAIADFTRSTVLKPDYPEARYNLGLALYFKGDMDKSIAQYDQVIKLRPNAYNALGNRCLAKIRKGTDPRMALQDCEAALRIQPNHAMNLAIRGVGRFKLQDFAGARNDCEAAIALDGEFGWPYYLRGLIKQRSNDPGAQVDLARGQSLDNNIQAKFRLMLKGESASQPKDKSVRSMPNGLPDMSNASPNHGNYRAPIPGACLVTGTCR